MSDMVKQASLSIAILLWSKDVILSDEWTLLHSCKGRIETKIRKVVDFHTEVTAKNN